MCRVLSYLGKPLLLEDLLYKPDNSLIIQSYDPKLMTHMLNLAGFGCIAWDYRSLKPAEPWLYHTAALPFFDKNLKNMASKVMAECMIAHIRGIEYSEQNVVANQNVHPFHFSNTDIAFAHNGSLAGFEDIRFDIHAHTKNAYRSKVQGTTDSESIYALFLSELDNFRKKTVSIENIFSALIETLKILNKIRKKHHIDISSPLNFFISNGEFIVASRFVFDYGHYPSADYCSPHMGYHSMWYTYGEKYEAVDGQYQMKINRKIQSIIIASEPLTEDSTTWIEVPEYSFIGAEIKNKQVITRSLDIVI